MAFGVMASALMILAIGIVISRSAAAIASGRDRRTLDALLASRFSSAEIVLGAVVAGLLPLADAATATLPVVVLLVTLAGVPPALVVLAGVGLASTAALLAGFSVAASVGARTGARAVVSATGWFGAWFALPPLYLISRPLAWPTAPAWLTWAATSAAEGSPIGLLMALVGLLPRRGGPVEAVGRMAAWQLAGALALLAWAVLRLRPASRSLHDVEGERGRIERLKATLRRPPRRPPCGDDPVFWHAVHSTRGAGLVRRVAGLAVDLAWLAALAWGTWWFARPAFAELAERGYGPSAEAFAIPEMHPLMRSLVRLRFPILAPGAAPGQARLEFNMGLRLLASVYALGFAASTFSGAFEGIKGERRRDTWLGLLTTPLRSREVLRGKALGALWKARRGVLTPVALGTVGLLAGAVHPLGFLALVAVLGASGAFAASMGLLMGLYECEDEARGRAAFPAARLPGVLFGGVFVFAGPLILAWVGLLTYEDVAAAARSGPFPEVREGPVAGWMGARGVLVAWLAGFATLAIAAVGVGRADERWFDEAVGRPVRPPAGE